MVWIGVKGEGGGPVMRGSEDCEGLRTGKGDAVQGDAVQESALSRKACS